MANGQYYESKEDRSGKLFEHFLFGDITAGKNSIRYQDVLKKYISRHRGKGNPAYLPRREAMDLVRDAHTGAIIPQKKFMRDVREEVAKRLGLNAADAPDLRIYSSVGTPLDVYHGVDAFIEFKTKQGETKVVTLDATINKKKVEDEYTKSQILITEVPDPMDQPKEYQLFVNDVAGKITAQLR